MPTILTPAHRKVDCCAHGKINGKSRSVMQPIIIDERTPSGVAVHKYVNISGRRHWIYSKEISVDLVADLRSPIESLSLLSVYSLSDLGILGCQECVYAILGQYPFNQQARWIYLQKKSPY